MPALSTQITGGVAQVTIDLPGEPVNKITADMRAELEELIGKLKADGDVRSVILRSGKPDTFIAGADIDEFLSLHTREEAESLVRSGQALINRLASLGKPVV